MKKILWVSRHKMTSEQIADLESVYGDIHTEILDSTIEDVKKIAETDADVYAVVLPAEMIAELQKILAPEKEIIVPVSARVKTGRTVYNKASDTQETEYIYRHLHWKKIISIEIKTEILRSVK